MRLKQFSRGSGSSFVFNRYVDIFTTPDNHAIRSLANEAVQDKPWKMSNVSHHEFNPPVHISHSRSDGYSHHEDTLAL